MLLRESPSLPTEIISGLLGWSALSFETGLAVAISSAEGLLLSAIAFLVSIALIERSESGSCLGSPCSFPARSTLRAEDSPFSFALGCSMRLSAKAKPIGCGGIQAGGKHRKIRRTSKASYLIFTRKPRLYAPLPFVSGVITKLGASAFQHPLKF